MTMKAVGGSGPYRNVVALGLTKQNQTKMQQNRRWFPSCGCEHTWEDDPREKDLGDSGFQRLSAYHGSEGTVCIRKWRGGWNLGSG